MDAEAFEFSRDGSTLAMGTGDGDVWVLDVSSGAVRTLKSEYGQVTDLVFSPDGSKLAAAYLNGPVYLWDLETNASQVLKEESGRRTVDVNSEGLLAIGGRSGVELFHLESGTSTVHLVSAEASVEATFLDDRTLVLTGEGIGQQIGDVALWDLDRKSIRFTFRGHTGSVECADATPDGRVIVAGRWNGSISIWRR